MDTINPRVEDEGSLRPEPSPEDKIVTSYMEEHSEIYRDLVKVQNDVRNNPQATAHFKKQRRKADNPTANDQKGFFTLMRKIGDEINTTSGGALKLSESKPSESKPRVLDLCMAPGGYTASALKHSPHANVCAFTLPIRLDGHQILHRRDERLKIVFGDITMLYKEFGLTDLPQDHPESSEFSDKRPWDDGKLFDLVFCDGQALRTQKQYIADYQQQVKAIRLNLSQLVLAMQRITSGGTLIMLLHDMGSYATIKLLSVFDKIAEIQLFKPVSGHKERSTFYLIAKKVQPGLPEAVAAVNEWKKIWKDLTFPALDPDGQRDPEKDAHEAARMEVHELLNDFAERVIEWGEPIWHMQKEALENG